MATTKEKPKYSRIDLRLRTEVKENLLDLAEMDGISATAFISSLISQKAREQSEALEQFRKNKK